MFKNTVLAVIAGFLLIMLYDWLVPFRADIQYAQIVEDRDGQPLTAFLSADERWRFETDLHDISPRFLDAIIYKEDRWFRWHPGVNPVAIVRALWNNAVSGRRTSGASTITMQVARLLAPSERTFTNKVLDMVHAAQLEMHYSKDEILRMYLSLVPYGGNIEGVKAAAMLFFNKTPLQLSLGEIAALMVIPNRPTTLRLTEDNARVVHARNVWLLRMQADGIANAGDVEDALAEPLMARRVATPRMARQLALRLRTSGASAQQPIVRTTIVRSVQEKVEALALNHSRRLASLGIYNASVIVVDNRTNNVVAYVGSANPDDGEHAGQVDGIMAIRSPGSTLKPLLYGMAFDRGFVTPRTMLQDVPINFDGYAPQNFDKQFHGMVSMDDALGRSLNVPAVSMLNRVGVGAFVDVLAKARMSSVTSKRKDLGLSVVLGGCGVRLDELTALYAGFANDGRFRPLRWTEGAPSQDGESSTGAPSPDGEEKNGVRILSSAAAWVITETLLKLERPDMPSNAALGTRIPRVAWKTGTSYGRRDAWSIGYNGNYTIGVWVGNYDGSGVQHLTGSEAATPLLFDVFNAIDRAGERIWHQRPKEIDFRLVCSVTGSVPSDSCTDQVIDDFIPGVSNSSPCNHVQEMFVSADSKTSYCVACLPDRGYRRASFLNLPAPVLALYRNEHLNVRTPPPHNPLCTRIESDGQIAITAPTANKEYILERPLGGGESRLQLRCQASADATSVFWYVNDTFLTAAPPDGAVFFEPEGGSTDITVMDDRGRKSTINIAVKHW